MAIEATLATSVAPDARILVARLDAVGDCILSSSFFIGLRQLFPKAHLTGAFRAEVAELYDHCPLFDRIIRMPPGPNAAWQDLLESPYDLTVLPRWDVDFWSTRQLALLSQAPIRVGFDRGRYRFDAAFDGWTGAYFTHLARTESSRHEVAKGHDLLRFLGGVDPMPEPRMWVPPKARIDAEDCIRRHRLQRFAVLSVAARWRNRVWPTESFLRVIDGLCAAAKDLRFLVIGGEDAVEAGAWLQHSRPDRVINAAGALPLLSSAAVIARSALYIGLDTGPMHMAAAAAVPVVEISCHALSAGPEHCNSPDRFGPYATRHRILRPARPLPPCVNGCEPETETHCITQIEALDVVDAALDLLAPR